MAAPFTHKTDLPGTVQRGPHALEEHAVFFRQNKIKYWGQTKWAQEKFQAVKNMKKKPQ